MKHFISCIASAIIACLTLSSCFQAMDENVQEQLGTEQGKQLVTFQFSAFGMTQGEMGAETRAITSTPTVLLAVDVLGGEVVNVVQLTKETETDNVLDALSLNMAYGRHTLYFLAAAKGYAEFDQDAMTVSWTTANANLNYTWARKLTVDVSNGPAATLNVELPLAVGRIELVCNDALDPDIRQMAISGAGICWTLDLTTMQGRESEDGIAISLPYTSTNYSNGRAFAFFSFEPVSESESTPNIGNVTFIAKRADGSEIASHTLSNVPVQTGYYTQYRGYFFSNNADFNLSLADDWTGYFPMTY